MIYDFITIGAGAAGLMFNASEIWENSTYNGLILEKTKRIGTKLLMSGSGQCNITHSGSIKEFSKCYGDKGGKIRSCLYKYSNSNLINFLECNGIPVFTREDGKVFPKSMDANDVLQMLLKRIHRYGFNLLTESNVTSISAESPSLWRVSTLENGSYLTKNLIISTGGCSYPKSGSDGAFFNVLSDELGVTISELKPSLTPIKPDNYDYTDLSGISFKNAHVQILPPPDKGGKAKASNINDILFTHKDLSGPGILNISKYAEPGDILTINYLYPLRYEEVFSKLKKESNGNSTDLHNIVSNNFAVPRRFSKSLCEKYGSSLKNLSLALTGETFTIKSVSGFNTAMATSGGVSLKELDLKTFQLKKHPQIYVIGEACDVDGITGGYNLQFAYSSAQAAANSIAASLSQQIPSK